MNALVRFLQALSALVVMKNGGQENDVSRLLNWGRLAVRAGDTGRRHMEAAAAKVEQLVAEDRAMNEQELADLDHSIRTKLARAASVVLPPEKPPADPPAAPTEDPPPDAPENPGGTEG